MMNIVGYYSSNINLNYFFFMYTMEPIRDLGYLAREYYFGAYNDSKYDKIMEKLSDKFERIPTVFMQEVTDSLPDSNFTTGVCTISYCLRSQYKTIIFSFEAFHDGYNMDTWERICVYETDTREFRHILLDNLDVFYDEMIKIYEDFCAQVSRSLIKSAKK